MDAKRQVQISKFLSLVLRHRPDAVGLALDSNGWVGVGDLLQALGRERFNVTLDDLRELVATDGKQRFAFNPDGTRIRANQGHSIRVDLGYQPEVPPEFLYHGTADRYLRSIRASGLLGKNRQYVHLSADEKTATQVGARHGKPVVMQIHASRMHEEGIPFVRSANGVWLTEKVPAKYIAFPDANEETASAVGPDTRALADQQGTMRVVKSCGVIVFRPAPRPGFLVMQHVERYDLPKGHASGHESELETALRELQEETGLTANDVRIDPTFRFTTTYYPRYKRFRNKRVEKTVVIFLGRLEQNKAIVLGEHPSYVWVDWNPPHPILSNTIDELLYRRA